MREGVKIECQERLLFEEAVPRIAFIARLPDRAVMKANDDGGGLLEVRVLYNRRREFELWSKSHLASAVAR